MHSSPVWDQQHPFFLPPSLPASGAELDVLFLAGSSFNPNPLVLSSSWGVFCPRMCHWGCVRLLGSVMATAVTLLVLGAITRELDRATGTALAHRGRPRAGWGGRGGTSPSAPTPCCTLRVVEGEGGRVPGCRWTCAGGCSCRAGEAPGGDSPGPLLLPLSLCCIKLISLALS